MSIYDDIRAKAGPAPAYPHKKNFTRWFGYAGGKPIGDFATRDEATKAGAVVTEPVVDQVAFDATLTAYQKYNTETGDEWYKQIRAEYPEVSDAVFAVVNGKAYEDGHHAGYGEVEAILSNLVPFAVAIIAASKE